jgi:hypothetical protein
VSAGVASRDLEEGQERLRRLAAAGEAISAVVRKFAAARVPLESAELEGEGWRAALEAWHGYDPARGPAFSYFYVVVRREVGLHVTRTLHPARLSRGAAKSGVAGAKVREPLEHWDGVSAHHEWDVSSRTPEAIALAREEEGRDERMRGLIRGMIDESLVGFNAYDRYLVHRLTGLDGHRREKANELAKRLRIAIGRVYRVHARLEKALWNNHRLYLLHRGAERRGEED